eukprot:TRINITY_DN7470_c0_g1_i1.p1 TRINITY_DN7470_c0_g1~~TRINITY_DN7470_c0_g1_i1.p1  ORF type:complete len:316 (+),score=38.12 TRINITY_DN7470_c0_g1_i1:67-948(+)
MSTAKTAIVSAGASVTTWLAMSSFQKTWDSMQEIVGAVRKIIPRDESPSASNNAAIQQQLAELLARTPRDASSKVIVVGGTSTGWTLGGMTKVIIVVGGAYCVLRISGHGLLDLAPVSRRTFDATLGGVCHVVEGVSGKVIQVGRDLGVLRQNMNEGFNKLEDDVGKVSDKVDVLGTSVERVEHNVGICKHGIQLLCNVVAETLAHHPSPSPAQQALRSFSSAAISSCGPAITYPTSIARITSEEERPNQMEPDSDEDSERVASPQKRGELSTTAISKLTATLRRVAEQCNNL